MITATPDRIHNLTANQKLGLEVIGLATKQLRRQVKKVTDKREIPAQSLRKVPSLVARILAQRVLPDLLPKISPKSSLTEDQAQEFTTANLNEVPVCLRNSQGYMDETKLTDVLKFMNNNLHNESIVSPISNFITNYMMSLTMLKIAPERTYRMEHESLPPPGAGHNSFPVVSTSKMETQLDILLKRIQSTTSGQEDLMSELGYQDFGTIYGKPEEAIPHEKETLMMSPMGTIAINGLLHHLFKVPNDLISKGLAITTGHLAQALINKSTHGDMKVTEVAKALCTLERETIKYMSKLDEQMATWLDEYWAAQPETKDD